MAKYGKLAQRKVKRAMHERKTGELKSGRGGKKVTSRKQAIAIGLSEARRAGGKVPKKKTAKKATKRTGRAATKRTGRTATKRTGRPAAKRTRKTGAKRGRSAAKKRSR